MEKNKVIIFAVLAIIALFLFGFNELGFTGRASSNIVDCYDSDGGKDANIGGNVIGSFDPTKAKSDFCVNATTLGEYYCDATRSDGKVEEIYCDLGCISEGGFGVCKSAVGGRECSQGCAYNGECLSIGTRVAGRYCDYSQALRVQKEGDCENSYECKSNLCLSGKCLSEEGGINFLEDSEQTYFWE